MIRVQYGDCRLLVQGHAGQAEYGRDIVCAAVSVLVLTLLRALLEAERVNQVRGLKYQARAGHAGVSCEPTKAVRRLFDFTKKGLDALASRYPQYIRIREGTPHKRALFPK